MSRNGEASAQTIVEAFRASVGNVAVVDCAGRIIAANKGWLGFARQHGGRARKIGPGANYLVVCQSAMQLGNHEACAALNGIMGVLDGSIPEFCLEYRCGTESEELWFELIVRPLCRPEGGAVITHLSRHTPELQGFNEAAVSRLAEPGESAAGVAPEPSQPLAQTK